MSARSSDSDVSDVSAISRASSASRLSSASYMSVQSERPHGRIRLEKLCTNMSYTCVYKNMHMYNSESDTYAYDEDTFSFYSVFFFHVNNLRLRLSSSNIIFFLNVCSYNHNIQCTCISNFLKQWCIFFGFISFYVFLHGFACVSPLCMLLSVSRLLLFSPHPHTSLHRRGSKVKITGELQRRGEKGEEDLMGGERDGAAKEPGKEAFLRGTETPAPHCGRRCQVTARWTGPALHWN